MRPIRLLKRVLFYVVILVLVLVLGILIKIALTPNGNSLTASITPTQFPKIVDLCTPFATDKEGVSCEEAKGIALKKYPGQVLSIDKATLPYQSGKSPKTQTLKKDIWIVGIEPNNPDIIPMPVRDSEKEKPKILGAIKISVDRNTKEILFIEPIFKK